MSTKKIGTFKEWLSESKLNENTLAKKFLSYINTEDWSSLDLSQDSIEDIESYLDIIEDEDEDAKYYLEKNVGKIDKIRDSLKDIGKIIKNKEKIYKLEKEIQKHKDSLLKLETELSKLYN